MEQVDYTNVLRDFLTVLFKHKLKILTVFAAVVTIVVYKTFKQIPVYEANSSLMVQVGREYIFRPEVGDEKPTLQYNRNEIIQSDIQILNSTDLIEKVITDLGLENIYPDLVKQPSDLVKQPSDLVKQPSVKITPLQVAIRRFKSQLSADVVRNSNVINVSFQDRDQQVPARVVNELVESFMERHLQLFSNPQTPFLERQLAVHRQRLQESESSLASFKQRNQITSFEQQRSLLLQQRVRLDTDLKTAQNRIQELRQMISSLTSQVQGVSENIPVADITAQSNSLNNAQANLLNLQIQEEELASKYEESNFKLLQIRNQIQIVKNFIAEQEERPTKSMSNSMNIGRNPIYQGMESERFQARREMSSTEAGCAALKQQLKQLDGEIQDLDAKEGELRGLERERDNNEKNYKLYLTKLEEARISDELDRSKKVSIKVIQKATDPLWPVPVRKRLQIAVGILLGATLGLALAFFFEFFIEEGVSSPEGVKKRLGLPVLATVPYKTQKKSRI